MDPSSHGVCKTEPVLSAAVGAPRGNAFSQNGLFSNTSKMKEHFKVCARVHETWVATCCVWCLDYFIVGFLTPPDWNIITISQYYYIKIQVQTLNAGLKSVQSVTHLVIYIFCLHEHKNIILMNIDP